VASAKDEALVAATVRQLKRFSTPLASQPPHGQDPPGVLENVYEFVGVELRGTDPASELIICFRQAVRPDCIFVASSGSLWTDANSKDPMIDRSMSWDDNAETIAKWLQAGIYSWGLPREAPAGTNGRVPVSWSLRGITRGD